MWRSFRLQRYIIALLLLSFSLGMLLGITLITRVDLGNSLSFGRNSRSLDTDLPENLPGAVKKSKESLLQKLRPQNPDIDDKKKEQDNVDLGKQDTQQEREEMLNKENTQTGEYPPPNYNIHVFYYPWYGNPQFDGKYLHWNHEYLPHWNAEEAKNWPKGRHEPPDDIGANFYPALGSYSSRDPAVIDDHMKQIRSAGIGVLAVSWYPPGDNDEQGDTWDDLIPELLDAADKYHLKICFHIEPFKDRNHVTMRKYIDYIHSQYSSHPAFYKRFYKGKSLPLYYIYDSYLVQPEDWGQVFKPGGALTVRGTEMDGLFIGLMVESKHKSALVTAGFDGFYTYFASDGFTYGSNTHSWTSLAAFSKASDMLFIPSVGPGYVDVRVRPWNRRNTKIREGGGYYEQSFKAALLAKPDLISITSFNEWHEGTQIEKAVPKEYKDFKYLDYLPSGSDYYLQLTKKWAEKFTKMRNNRE